MLLADGEEVALGRISARCDLALADALARLQLAAQRRGCAIRLRGVSEPMRELLELVGLAELVADPW